MANISNNAYRSRLAQTVSGRVGPQGFHHNPGDFSERSGSSISTRHGLLRAKWDYLPAHVRANSQAVNDGKIRLECFVQ